MIKKLPNRLRLAILFVAAATLLYSCFPGKKGIREEEENEMYDGPMARDAYEQAKIIDPALGYVPYNRLDAAIEQTIARKSAARTYLPLTWEERGPIYDSVGPSNGNGRGGGVGSTAGGYTSGRIRAFLLDTLNDPTGNTAITGSVGGGIWRCTNFLDTDPDWVSIDDNFSNIAIGSIGQDPSNPQIIYVATGEPTSNADAIYGNGVYKSTDGGLTFHYLPSSSNFRKCYKVACDAAGNVYVATRITTIPVVQTQGLYRSSNGGTTWTDITPNDLTASNNTCTDFEFTANGNLNAVFGYFLNTTGVVNQRYTSNPATVTAGTWQTGTGFRVAPNAIRTKLAVSGNVLYAITINGSYNSDSCYRSLDAGVTWTKQNTVVLPSGLGSGQGWYNLSMAINPTNSNELIAGGLDAYRSTNGGANWTKFTNWVSTAPYVHADHHYAQYWMKNGETRMIMTSDGGIFYSTDNGATFKTKNKNLSIKQFYDGAIHPAAGSNYLLAGAQDNGTHQLKNPGKSFSIEVTGGDGCMVHISQVNPNLQFGSYVYNQYRRSTNGGATWSSVNFSSSVGLFVNPFDHDDNQNIMYCSNGPLSQIRRWANTTVSPSTSTSLQFASATLGGSTVSLTSIRVSLNTANRVFFGTNNGRVFRLDNANTVTNANIDANTTNIGSASFPPGTVNCIAHGTDDNNLVAVWSNYGVNNVWITTDGGTNWSAIDGDLPDMPVRWALFEPGDNNKLYIATEAGVYTTTKINGASTSWLPEPGFPVVKTNTLEIRTSDSTIVAATHGRGLWTAKIPPCASAAINTQPSNTVTCPGQTATFTVGATGSGLAYQWQVSTDNGATWTNIPGATGATLNVPNVNNTMNGWRYRNIIDTYCSGLLTSNGAVLNIGSSPSFTSCPPNMTVSNAANQCGATVTYPAAVAAGLPAPTLSYSIPSGSFFPKGTTAVTVTATNACGTQTCTFNVTVNDVQPPTITCPSNITVTAPLGSCSANVSYTVTPADNCPGVTITRTAGPASGGSFPVGTTTVTHFATDAGGLVSAPCSFTVTVIDPQLPAITAQPANRTVCAGQTATFSVTATNAGTYQWQAWNGSTWNNIPGATGSTYSVTNTTFAMNTNSYRVIVNGLCTPVTSNHATLYVNPLPQVNLVTSRSPILMPPDVLTITAVVNPPGGSFVWYKNGSVMTPTSPSNALVGLTVDNVGTYKVVYTDPNGCVTTSGDVVVSAPQTGNLYIFPSPNNGQFQIRFYNQPNEQVTVRVFDSKGAKIYQQVFTIATTYAATSVNLGAATSNGIYLVEVWNSAGKKVGTKRIVVKK